MRSRRLIRPFPLRKRWHRLCVAKPAVIHRGPPQAADVTRTDQSSHRSEVVRSADPPKLTDPVMQALEVGGLPLAQTIGQGRILLLASKADLGQRRKPSDGPAPAQRSRRDSTKLASTSAAVQGHAESSQWTSRGHRCRGDTRPGLQRDGPEKCSQTPTVRASETCSRCR